MVDAILYKTLGHFDVIRSAQLVEEGGLDVHVGRFLHYKRLPDVGEVVNGYVTRDGGPQRYQS